MPFASALSVHPVTAHAVGEVVGQVLERTGDGPDLAVAFVSPHHAGALEDAAGTIRAVLRPKALVGCAAEAVLGDGREVEDEPAIALWAASVGEVETVALGGGSLPAPPPFEPSALLLLADPFSFPADDFFAALAGQYPGLPVVGGNASAARGPGGNRLVVNDRILTSGAVGAFVGPGVEVVPVTSQGCRPIGEPYTVTRAEQNIVFELGGKPALERLMELVPSLTESEVAMINAGRLHVGRVIDEHKVDFGRGDFLAMNVLGASQEVGAIAVGSPVEVGTTVQFELRDAASADEDLRALLTGRDASGALVFTCNGRGTRLFPEPHHDAQVVAEALDDPPTAGFFAAGEFGPVGGRNFVHGFTASVVLFREASPGRG